MKLLIVPITDYFKTRKRISLKLILSAIPALALLLYALLFDVKPGIDITVVFSDFVNVQIGAMAILISFSIAIITILVSADNANIVALKTQENANQKIKKLDGKSLSLYQILLSNIVYNVYVEIIYLMALIFFVFFQMVISLNVIKYLTAICIFFIVHILHLLLESIAQMYMTFWSNRK